MMVCDLYQYLVPTHLKCLFPSLEISNQIKRTYRRFREVSQSVKAERLGIIHNQVCVEHYQKQIDGISSTGSAGRGGVPLVQLQILDTRTTGKLIKMQTMDTCLLEIRNTVTETEQNTFC